MPNRSKPTRRINARVNRVSAATMENAKKTASLLAGCGATLAGIGFSKFV